MANYNFCFVLDSQWVKTAQANFGLIIQILKMASGMISDKMQFYSDYLPSSDLKLLCISCSAVLSWKYTSNEISLFLNSWVRLFLVNKYLGVVKYLNTLTIAVGDDQSIMTHHSSKDYTALYRRFANFYTLFYTKNLRITSI